MQNKFDKQIRNAYQLMCEDSPDTEKYVKNHSDEIINQIKESWPLKDNMPTDQAILLAIEFIANGHLKGWKVFDKIKELDPKMSDGFVDRIIKNTKNFIKHLNVDTSYKDSRHSRILQTVDSSGKRKARK